MPRGDDLPIQIVDEDDNPIGTASISEAQQKGLIHRVVRIMVEDTDGRILLQKRSPTRTNYPDCWDNSAAGHVDAGETYEEAATRELKEEVGIDGVELEPLLTYRTNGTYKGRRLYRFNRLYRAVVPPDTHLALQKEEVAEAKWVTKDELRQLVASHPDGVSDGLIEVDEKYYSQ